MQMYGGIDSVSLRQDFGIMCGMSENFRKRSPVLLMMPATVTSHNVCCEKGLLTTQLLSTVFINIQEKVKVLK